MSDREREPTDDKREAPAPSSRATTRFPFHMERAIPDRSRWERRRIRVTDPEEPKE